MKSKPVQQPAQAPEPLKPPEPMEVGGARIREEKDLGRYGGLNLRVKRPTDNTLGGLKTGGTGVNMAAE